MGHFGAFCLPKPNKPIWPIPVTPSDIGLSPLQPSLRYGLRSESPISDLQKACYTGSLSRSSSSKQSSDVNGKFVIWRIRRMR
jgi:hypothetical protein